MGVPGTRNNMNERKGGGGGETGEPGLTTLDTDTHAREKERGRKEEGRKRGVSE